MLLMFDVGMGTVGPDVSIIFLSVNNFISR